MKILKALGFAALIAASGTASQAAVVYATSVDSYTQGTGITDPSRTVTSKALGAPDGKFLTLGLGGEAIFSFGKIFKAPGGIHEITFGQRDAFRFEQVEVFVGLSNVFVSLGKISNALALTTFNFIGTFDQVKLVDMSPAGAGRDGYEVDALYVSAVPVPAAGLLLLSVLGGLSFLRSRKA